MSRRAWLTALSALVVAGSALGLPAAVRAAGQWTTYLHAGVGTDIIAMRDTVLIATREAGILRYLRRSGSWESITHEPSGIAGNNVGAITFDRHGNLFAAVPGKGVSRLDTDGRWTLINTFDGLPSDSALSLRAQGDSVWIGTTRGLAIWDGTTIAGSVPDLGTPSPFVDNNINGIAITGDTLFVSSPRGVQLARLSQRISSWTLVNNGLPTDRDTLAPVKLNVSGLACDGHNVFTVASGANPSNPAQNILTSFRWFPGQGRWGSDAPPNPQVRRLRDDFGFILATVVNSATLPAGTFLRAANGVWNLVPGSPATDVGDAFEGGVEVGCDPGGTTFAWAQQQMLEQTGTGFTARTPPGPVGNDCRNTMVSNGSVYALYFGEGVSRLRNGVWRNFRAGTTCTLPACDADTTFSSSTFPFGMLLAPSGTKWISMWDGPLARFDDETNPPAFTNIRFASGDASVVHQHSCGHALVADSTKVANNAGIWDGLDTDNDNPALGIDLYRPDGTFVRNYNAELQDPLIRALEVDRNNQMWVGYNAKGVATFAIPDTLGSPITVKQITGTERLKVFGIASHQDSVWVLADDGLHRFTTSASQVSILQIAGAPSLLGVRPVAVANDGTVYVGTTGGLRVHRRGERAVDFTPDNSPLADLEVRGIWVEPSGVAWIGTARGLNRYDPNFAPSAPPPLAKLNATLYPNPAWVTGVGFELRVKGQATSYDGEVYDLNGRVVHRFHAGGNGVVLWNGFDTGGTRVGPGVYFVRLRGGGAEATSRVVVLR